MATEYFDSFSSFTSSDMKRLHSNTNHYFSYFNENWSSVIRVNRDYLVLHFCDCLGAEDCCGRPNVEARPKKSHRPKEGLGPKPKPNKAYIRLKSAVNEVGTFVFKTISECLPIKKNRTKPQNSNKELLRMLSQRFRKLVSFIKGEKKKRTKSLVTRSQKKVNGGREVVLPDNVLNKILDHSSPYDVAKWRLVNKKFNETIKKRYETILYLDVWRMDLDELLPRGIDNDGDFFRHRSANLLVHVEAHSVIIVINHEWSVKDVVKLWQGLQAFRTHAHTIMLDASVFELTMAGLALRDITRWFNFMCSLSRSSDDEKRPVLRTRPGQYAAEPFFPNVKELTIRTTYPELKQLRRVPEYGVPTTHLFNAANVQLIRVNIANGRNTGSPQHTRYSRYLILFRRWMNAASLGEKYCQQYS